MDDAPSALADEPPPPPPGYYGRVVQARNKARGGAFSAEEAELLRFTLGSPAIIGALSDGVAGMRAGGIRRLVVSPGPLFYPLVGDPFAKGPKPTTFSGERALRFVLDNQGLVDKTLLFDGAREEGAAWRGWSRHAPTVVVCCRPRRDFVVHLACVLAHAPLPPQWSWCGWMADEGGGMRAENLGRSAVRALDCWVKRRCGARVRWLWPRQWACRSGTDLS